MTLNKRKVFVVGDNGDAALFGRNRDQGVANDALLFVAGEARATARWVWLALLAENVEEDFSGFDPFFNAGHEQPVGLALLFNLVDERFDALAIAGAGDQFLKNDEREVSGAGWKGSRSL